MALPCEGQNTASIYAWAQRLAVGDKVAIRQSYSHIHFEYTIATVKDFTDKGRRVMIESGETFWRTEKAAGKHCFHPKGQRSMIQPTKAVRAAAKAGGWYQRRD